jgi:hypothetical protein
MYNIYKFFKIGFCMFYLITPLLASENPSIIKKPIGSISNGLTHLSSTHPHDKYTSPNTDGKLIQKGLNYHFSINGRGYTLPFIVVDYELYSNSVAGPRLKKGSLFLKSQSVSLEIGRNNIWLGNGYYGSLLLSNNAEPYTLIRFRTEKPMHIPYIGRFDYTLFHGWPRDFNLLGHQMTWYPVSWLEFNLKQTIVYTGTYSMLNFLEMFTGKEANIGGDLGRTDSRASVELAIHLEFVKQIARSVTNVKIYGEYGGEDLYAHWQVPDAFLDKELWLGPFGFQFLDTGVLAGMIVETATETIILEYAQNYKSYYLFYDPYKGGRPYNVSWYRHTSQPAFQNYGNIMGHHMGSAAELLSFHYTRSFGRISASVMFSRRHRWHIVLEEFNRSYKSGLAERQDALGGTLEYKLNRLEFSFNLHYNYYKNTDSVLNPLVNRPVSGERAKEIISGFEVRLTI